MANISKFLTADVNLKYKNSRIIIYFNIMFMLESAGNASVKR